MAEPITDAELAEMRLAQDHPAGYHVEREQLRGLLARLGAAERERDEARATAGKLNRRVGEMESEAARVARIEARIRERDTRRPLPRIEAAFALAAAEERIATLEAVLVEWEEANAACRASAIRPVRTPESNLDMERKLRANDALKYTARRIRASAEQIAKEAEK